MKTKILAGAFSLVLALGSFLSPESAFADSRHKHYEKHNRIGTLRHWHGNRYTDYDRHDRWRPNYRYPAHGYRDNRWGPSYYGPEYTSRWNNDGRHWNNDDYRAPAWGRRKGC